MMNFDEFVRNLNKANEEIEKLTAETNVMQEDIVNEEQRKLDAFMAKLKPMMKLNLIKFILMRINKLIQ